MEIKESLNVTRLSKLIENSLINELVTQGNIEPFTAITIVRHTDLEKEFLSDLVANLVMRCNYLDRNFDFDYNIKESDLYRIAKGE
jgi:hypothetical protein